MSPITPVFALFVFVGLALYYALPKSKRWIVLLLLSVAFYACGGIHLLGYLLFASGVTYVGGLLIGEQNLKIKAEKDKAKQYKAKKRLSVSFALVLNFGLLFLLKYLPVFLDALKLSYGFNIILPLGISFYIFQTSGYVIDIYRDKYPPERNPAKFLLFASFFPQMIQGPIGRFDALSKQLYSGNDFSYDNAKAGLKLICMGLFKKLVLADRASVPAGYIIDSYQSFSGAEILAGVILYCIQLYCDFSGGIDIMRGVARLFGIELALNFKRPIFATSLTDFWRRWHITLGSWMKDYVFYQITLSKPFARLSKLVRKHLSGRSAKIIPVSLATFVIYFLIGIWHGGSMKYIVFGFWNGLVITASLLAEPYFVWMKSRLHINESSRLYKFFCVARTSILVLFGRYITRAENVTAALEMLKKTVCSFNADSLLFAQSGLMQCGLKTFDFVVIAIGVIVLLALEYCEEHGKPMSDRLNNHSALQLVFCLASILTVVFLGFYSGDYISPDFIYKQF